MNRILLFVLCGSTNVLGLSMKTWKLKDPRTWIPNLIKQEKDSELNTVAVDEATFLKEEQAYDGQAKWVPNSRGTSQKKKCTWPSTWKSYSRGGEDKFLYEHYFCDQKNGQYLEMGAVDGLFASNTKILEDKLGWGGVLIEPGPAGKRIHLNRGPLNRVLRNASCPQEQGTVEQNHVWGLSGEKGTLPCAPLGSMLNKEGVKKLDLFVLDVEGHELEVLKTMDWNIPVGVWMVEMLGLVAKEMKETPKNNLFNVRKDYEVQALLEQHGYIMMPGTMGVNNKIFEHPNLTKVNK